MKDTLLIKQIDDFLWKASTQTNIRKLRDTQRSIRLSMQDYFSKQNTSFMRDNTWKGFLPKGKRMRLYTWQDDFAKALEPNLRRVMKASADMVQNQLPQAIPTIDWDSMEMKGYVREYARNLAKEINNTTNMRIRKSLRKGLAAGENETQLKQRVHDIMKSAYDSRANIIARTELRKAHTAAAIQMYRKAGLDKKRWLANYTACSTCKALDGRSVLLDTDFAPDVFGPPLHPACRCVITPVKYVGWAHGA
jgi:SPP1 gp7 family putative phage head morphogenesis protein